MPERLLKSEELPPPSAELVLYRVHVEALISVLGKKKAEKYLAYMAERVAWEENLASVFQIRPSSEHEKVREARREAAAIFERYLPIFLARIPRD